MNIISNCCAGGEMYVHCFGLFTNPFIWNVIPFDSIFNLIVNYKNIDFKNIEIIKSNLLNRNDIYKIVIDNKVEVHYIHHRYLAGCKYKKDEKYPNIYMEDLVLYLLINYNKRLKRMLDKNDEPYFLILDNREPYELTLDEIIKLSNIDTEYKIILVSNKDLYNITFPKNMKWINFDGSKHVTFCKQYKNEIINFFNNK